jgi:hypothetical protein
MAGKFLDARGMMDGILSERAANSGRRRDGKMKHPIHAYKCGCSSSSCGAGFYCDDRFVIPTAHECKQIMRAKKLGFEHDAWHPRNKDGKLIFFRVRFVKNFKGGDLPGYLREELIGDEVFSHNERLTPNFKEDAVALEKWLKERT